MEGKKPNATGCVHLAGSGLRSEGWAKEGDAALQADSS